jgi:hypothetical protein
MATRCNTRRRTIRGVRGVRVRVVYIGVPDPTDKCVDRDGDSYVLSRRTRLDGRYPFVPVPGIMAASDGWAGREKSEASG